MDDSGDAAFSGAVRSDLMRKLENPLGFSGESTLTHVMYEGAWTRVSDILKKARKGPSQKDRVLSSLRERLEEIRSKMRSPTLSKDEAYSLFEEGITVKKSIYTLRNDVAESDEHSDTKRWLNYGRSIS
jgi:hypothetical protein